MPPLLVLFLSLSLALIIVFSNVSVAHAQDDLTVEIVAGYNLVVDSNVESPSTYAPSVATILGRFCNTSTTASLTNVQGFIGDFTQKTPGLYPQRIVDAAFVSRHPALDNAPGSTYAFSHMGGSRGTADAVRFIGTLAPGECKVQYWHVHYPQCENNLDGSEDVPACDPGNSPTWGDSVKPNDDLWLTFDIWATSDTSSANATWTMHMRNEISAMANKIQPHPNGMWFNTRTDQIAPGEVITSNGVYYSFGNVRFGFDNDGDYRPDYNAWAQPIGAPSYDPSCFRLIRTSGVITVARSSSPDLFITFDDREDPDPLHGGPLYFTNLPDDNTNVEGNIHYTFLALDGPCSTTLTPYQEVASGYDNEKFNGDYGSGIPPLRSTEARVTIDKTSNPATVSPGMQTTYRIPLTNLGGSDAGLGLSTGGTNPLVISDTVPSGMHFVAASYSLNYAPNNGVTTRYSTDSGGTWALGLPPTSTLSQAPGNLVIIQWWLNDPLPAFSTGSYAQLTAEVPGAYGGTPFVENCAEASFGDAPAFDRACTTILVPGDNSVGDLVWRDDDGDGLQDTAEPGLPAVTVTLYWDRNTNGLKDVDDVLLDSQTTDATGTYLFDNLPDGAYLVQADRADPDLPMGYAPTTSDLWAVDLDSAGANPDPTTVGWADFGFGPVLLLDKKQVSAEPAYEGDLVTYTLELVNTRPGDASGQPSACQYYIWATIDHPNSSFVPAGGGPANAQWLNTPSALSRPDEQYATTVMNDNSDLLGLSGFNRGPQLGAIVQVEAVLYTKEIVNLKPADQVHFRFYYNDSQQGSDFSWNGQDHLTGPTGATNILTADVTALHPLGSAGWEWSDFGANLVEMQIEGDKGGGQGSSGDMGLDAAAYRITTDRTCGGPEDTIDPLPLTDTFDAGKLGFVSASPAASHVATGNTSPYSNTGTITWDDLGPLYAGQAKQVTVTFRALEPPDSDNPADGEADPTMTDNCGASGGTLGAVFLAGDSVNDATDCATTSIHPAGTIGDTIWNDNGGPLGSGTPDNGIQDGDEMGIPGVRVYLCTALPCTNANAIATTVTDADGRYLFEGLVDGIYYTAVDTASLPGTSFSQTGDPDESPPACTVCDNTGTASLNNSNGHPNDDDDLSQDYGYQIPNAIYGSVWEDNDASASRDSGENGLPSVTVYLCTAGVVPCNAANALLATATDTEGDYAFGELADGEYYLTVDTSTLPPGADWTNSVDPEGSPGDSESNTIYMAGGNIYGSYDFGYHRSGSYTLGDSIYTDWNGDGSQGPGEEGLAGISVRLYQDDNGDGVLDPAADGLIAATSTASNGVYGFSGLAAQNYLVVVDENDPDFPRSFVQTQDPDETGICGTCNAQGSTTLGPDDLSLDWGYQPQGAGVIGDYVWQDNDGDGVQDPGEPGIAGITVTLYEDSDGGGLLDAEDATVTVRVTDANGNYLFTGLPPGNYLVRVDTADSDLPMDPFGQPYVLSTANDPHVANLGTGEEYLAADFGFTSGGLIGDYVWRDDNADGLQDPGEPGIANIAVYLCVTTPCDSGNAIETTQTDASGTYKFTSLPAGDYAVAIDTSTLPAGYLQTGDADLTSPCSAGDCDSQSRLYLAAGQIDRSRDFGYRPPGVMGDTVWIDSNGNGVQDIGEAGIPYVTVELVSSNCTEGTTCPTTVTDSQGQYYFGALAYGAYTVVVHEDDPDWPSGLVQTFDPDGGNDGRSTTVLDTANPDDLEQDYGYQSSGDHQVSGHVFYDSWSDGGLYDPAVDTPYGGITAYLWDSNHLLVSTVATSLSDGSFAFDNLPDGTYTVAINTSAPALAGTTMTATPAESGVCTTCQGYHPVTISGADVDDQDWGFWSPVPVAVTLASFTAIPNGANILVMWETVEEVDTLGFNLYRSESPETLGALLNNTLIPSQLPPGSPVGAEYRFRDDTVQSNVHYYYWLEDVGAGGESAIHGPATAALLPAQPQTTMRIYLPIVHR